MLDYLKLAVVLIAFGVEIFGLIFCLPALSALACVVMVVTMWND